MGSGETLLLDVPAPLVAAGCLLIASRLSLISTGTERMLVQFGQASMLQKARQQPEKVRMVLDKVRTDGLQATIDAVRSKLDQPLPLGYCNVGMVLEAGAGVHGFKPGDRVVSNGNHASVVSVPANLCAHIPASVEDDAAVFTVVASIGLQGVRLAAPTLGETVVVTGLGLIGLLTVQLLRANGCQVIGIDPDAGRLALATQLGAAVVNPTAGESAVAAALALNGGRGVDAVIITASTDSSEPVSQAAQMCRQRGRIILVGVTGLELNRAEFYAKELSFQVSCSYGPGRYDPGYEIGGNDYPLGFVRWTEQRNFSAVLALLAEGKLDTRMLSSSRYDIGQAVAAYQQLADDKSALGIVLAYPPADQAVPLNRRVALQAQSAPATEPAGAPVVGFIGAGNYGSRILIPAFRSAGAILDTVVTNTGAGGVHHGSKAGFAAASTQLSDVIDNPRINTVAIATRHNTHAGLTIGALKAGKHVFVEKPLALTQDEVAAIESTLAAAAADGVRPLLMVGFNRRFAPLVRKMHALLQGVAQPKAFSYTCNAGMIPRDHWTQDPSVGGGRIIGEACHFIDLLRFLVGAPIIRHDIISMGQSSDNAIISLKFADGSIGTIQYFATGGKVFPKERVEVFAGNAVLQLDNFRRLRGFGWRGFNTQSLWRQDKGHAACAAAYLNAVRNGLPAPIPVAELLEVARVSIALAQQQLDG
jgi:predicted dehydrogenase/threonine dehydrogenase-like Zn-dependent dehydrogenase